MNGHVASRVSVGISTRDRWENLQRTILKSSQFLPAEVQYLIAIDGGTADPSFKNAWRGLKISWFEHERNEGYIVRRNQLIAQCGTDYYLSLDDDSYPVAGDIAQAVAYMDATPEVGVLGFQIQRPDLTFQVTSKRNTPYQTRSFVGCAHLLRVDLFNSLGGYDDTLVHQGEESHYGALLMQHGYSCMHYPGLNFLHEATTTARSSDRVRYYAARNKMLWAKKYSPTASLMTLKLARGCAEQIVCAARERSFARVRGLLASCRREAASKVGRGKLSVAQYKVWNRLDYY
jgi:GT2 family glycosyltransferase